jgi:hypothetical protein
MLKSDDYTFCQGKRPRILDDLPKGPKSNQDDYFDNLLLALNQARTGNARHKVAPTLMVHIDNSMCHNGATTTKKMPLR